jgi:hypothetical protein
VSKKKEEEKRAKAHKTSFSHAQQAAKDYLIWMTSKDQAGLSYSA